MLDKKDCRFDAFSNVSGNHWQRATYLPLGVMVVADEGEDLLGDAGKRTLLVRLEAAVERAQRRGEAR